MPILNANTHLALDELAKVRAENFQLMRQRNDRMADLIKAFDEISQIKQDNKNLAHNLKMADKKITELVGMIEELEDGKDGE